ncbi:alpha/beta hydrolase [Solimonas sp. K1W22B-7]|uniref:alpha/beta hydrolase n=1 Tax=Solimonas sp. K1W22B-7 TaxID=2303331 RepID=UPI000E333BD0|nr:alpha/beta hydrolase [Solimonas sp. K1W22B-7]AXQ27608.1 alpha/beta hydrolase [Solimonas sp. K1W22B-7]
MYDSLRLGFFRWFIRVLLKFKWRGKFATDLELSNETMPVEGGRIGVRIYTPRGRGPFPILHFFHGGGWVGGDLDTHDPLCRDLCTQSRHLLVAFDYRLAPEYPFPIPIRDCLASLVWIRAHAARLSGDADRIVLCGDSAGGNLAAVTAQQARTLHPGLLKGQVLIYPVTDHCGFAQWPSYRTHGGRGFNLTHKAMTELWDFYLRKSPLWIAGASSHELATPLRVANLQALPPALFVIAEEDLLKDEAAEYARLMQQAGNDAQVKRYPGQQHGFLGFEPSAAHKQAVADIAGWLNAPGR